MIIIGSVFLCILLNAQNTPSTPNYYYANGVPQYWVEDPTSINIIVPSMATYNTVIERLEMVFIGLFDEIIADDEDDNIMAKSFF